VDSWTSASRWTDLDGPVFYLEWPGPRNSPTFVLLHGLGGSHANWVRAAPALSELGRVLVPDLAGSGRTPRAGRSSGVAANRGLLSRFLLQICDGGPVVLCGNSLGGSLALLQAACEPDSVLGVAANGAALPPAPGRAPSAVVLSGTAIYALPEVGEILGWLRLKALPPEWLIRMGFKVVLGDPSTVPEDVRRLHVELVRDQQAEPDAVQAFVQTTRSILAWMTRPDLARAYIDAVTCPVLLMHGGRDRVVPLKPTLAAAKPDWDVRVFPELGHVSQLEAPDVWLDEVRRWVERNGWAGR